MTKKQILRSSTIIVLGNIQLIPCLLCLSSTIIACALGMIYSLLLAFFWSSTIIGKGFFKNFVHETDRLEKFLLGKNVEC